MKTTDFAMIFVAIILPIIIVVYVDVAFMLKTEENKLYYINIINSAIDDATYAMKAVEGEDAELDYGYSGISEKRVAINPNIAVQTFFKSLYDNFEIEGDKISEAYLKEHVPAMAILDYNGVYIYSLEEYKTKVDGEETTYMTHMLKPKRHFAYTYGIVGDTLIPQEKLNDYNLSSIKLYTVNFTMDDYIYIIDSSGNKIGFFMEDNANNHPLYEDNSELKEEIIRHLKQQRSETLSSVVSEEMSNAVNKHNYYSKIDYEFFFPAVSIDDWQQMVDNIGIIAFLQGISIGNDKLDYTAHAISGLKVTDRYYVSRAREDSENELDYYHISKECQVYQNQLTPIKGYYFSQIDAASIGYYPCPICNP